MVALNIQEFGENTVLFIEESDVVPRKDEYITIDGKEYIVNNVTYVYDKKKRIYSFKEAIVHVTKFRWE